MPPTGWKMAVWNSCSWPTARYFQKPERTISSKRSGVDGTGAGIRPPPRLTS